MKVLYLSCHSINENEDIKLFSELGHQIVSQGSYNNPAKPGDPSRPALPEVYYNPEMAKIAATLKWNYETTSLIPSELIDWCDAIYILGIQVWLTFNWERIKKKIVIFRSIGQSVESTEKILQKYRPEGLKIVRYSPKEQLIPSYVGADATIRFYKDENEYKDWTGEDKQIITVAQAMKTRDEALKFSLFETCTRDFPRTLYGFANQNVSELPWGGALTYEQLKQALIQSRVFFYTCTFPAPYTMGFIEAWMTGTPVVAIGQKLAAWPWFEVPEFIMTGVNGFTSNSVDELRSYISTLLEDYELAKKISVEGRRKAIELFGKEKIKQQWRAFFDDL